MLAAILVVALPTAMWFSTRRAAWERWLPRVVGTESVGHGEYRDGVVERLRADGPPAAVRAAALGCWVLGTMFVPGLALGLYGLVFAGLGLISIPGLILAARLFLLGAPLLRAEPAAAAKARSLARFARVLNYVVLALCGGALVMQIPAVLRHGIESSNLGGVGIALAIALYAGVSLGHAALLIRSAEDIEGQRPFTDAELSGLRIGGDASALPQPEEEAVAPTQEERDALTR